MLFCCQMTSYIRITANKQLFHKKYIEDKYAGKRITGCRTAQEVVHDQLADLDHEEVWLIHLTASNKVIAAEMVAMGTLTETSVDCRTVLRSVLLQNAACFVIAHNHPSGEPRPSVSDIKFTAQLKKACDLMDIKLLDHIVLSSKAFYSFAQEETLNY